MTNDIDAAIAERLTIEGCSRARVYHETSEMTCVAFQKNGQDRTQYGVVKTNDGYSFTRALAKNGATLRFIEAASPTIQIELTTSDVDAVVALMDLINHPKKYGCSIYLGYEESYDERCGHVFDSAEKAIEKIADLAKQRAM
jgi:hypothetical protein